MTTQEARDELARVLGYKRGDMGDDINCWLDANGQYVCQHPYHPIAPTVDFLLRLWKEKLEGWEWRRTTGNSFDRLEAGLPSVLCWFAWSSNRSVSVVDTGDIYHDFLALTLKALAAKGVSK